MPRAGYRRRRGFSHFYGRTVAAGCDISSRQGQIAWCLVPGPPFAGLCGDSVRLSLVRAWRRSLRPRSAHGAAAQRRLQGRLGRPRSAPPMPDRLPLGEPRRYAQSRRHRTVRWATQRCSGQSPEMAQRLDVPALRFDLLDLRHEPRVEPEGDATALSLPIEPLLARRAAPTPDGPSRTRDT